MKKHSKSIINEKDKTEHTSHTILEITEVEEIPEMMIRIIGTQEIVEIIEKDLIKKITKERKKMVITPGMNVKATITLKDQKSMNKREEIAQI